MHSLPLTLNAVVPAGLLILVALDALCCLHVHAEVAEKLSPVLALVLKDGLLLNDRCLRWIYEVVPVSSLRGADAALPCEVLNSPLC